MFLPRACVLALVALTGGAPGAAPDSPGPAAALAYAESFRGGRHSPAEQHCYPDARGIPFAETENIVPMTAALWRPAALVADFQRRMSAVPAAQRKKGILVVLKTERCVTQSFRACSVTTAALEKQSTPLAAEFLIYGVWLQPRDHDDPPGSRPIETGADAWKNEAAGEYGFRQGPGATLVFLDPQDGRKLLGTNALALGLHEAPFVAAQGRTPRLHARMEEVLAQLARRRRSG